MHTTLLRQCHCTRNTIFFTLIPRFCQQQKYLCARQLISNADVVKAGGLQSQDVKGEIVVSYLDPLTTQDLKFSGFPDVLGRSSKSEVQRVNNMAKSIFSLELTIREFQKITLIIYY